MGACRPLIALLASRHKVEASWENSGIFGGRSLVLDDGGRVAGTPAPRRQEEARMADEAARVFNGASTNPRDGAERADTSGPSCSSKSLQTRTIRPSDIGQGRPTRGVNNAHK